MAAVETIIFILPIWLSLNSMEHLRLLLELIRVHAGVLGEVANGVLVLGLVALVLLFAQRGLAELHGGA